MYCLQNNHIEFYRVLTKLQGFVGNGIFIITRMVLFNIKN
jgi:hypothetical protein